MEKDEVRTAMKYLYLKGMVPSEVMDSKFQTTASPSVFTQTRFQVSSVYFLNWRNSWKDKFADVEDMICMADAGWKSKMKNTSTIESKPWEKGYTKCVSVAGYYDESDKIWYT